ncbi:MAG: hypothetical protein AAFR98_06740 [Pseudomonadota bacterium]
MLHSYWDIFTNALARSDSSLDEFIRGFQGFVVLCLFGFACFRTAKFWRDLAVWRMSLFEDEAGKWPTRIWSYVTPSGFLVTHLSPGAKSDDPVQQKYRAAYYRGLLWVGAIWCAAIVATVLLRLAVNALTGA